MLTQNQKIYPALSVADHPAPPETLPHLLTQCRGTAAARERIFPELLTIIHEFWPEHPLLHSPLSLHQLRIEHRSYPVPD